MSGFLDRIVQRGAGILANTPAVPRMPAAALASHSLSPAGSAAQAGSATPAESATAAQAPTGFTPRAIAPAGAERRAARAAVAGARVHAAPVAIETNAAAIPAPSVPPHAGKATAAARGAAVDRDSRLRQELRSDAQVVTAQREPAVAQTELRAEPPRPLDQVAVPALMPSPASAEPASDWSRRPVDLSVAGPEARQAAGPAIDVVEPARPRTRSPADTPIPRAQPVPPAPADARSQHQSQSTAEGSRPGDVEIHIGRIEVKVAAASPPPPSAPARTAPDFRRYRSVRNCTDRGWY
jgi:hypothetical protein